MQPSWRNPQHSLTYWKWLTTRLWMLLLQRPQGFPRSCWAAWTSWLKNTQKTQDKSKSKHFACLDVDRLCCLVFFFSQTHTHRTGCPWVSLHPVCFPLLAILPWDTTEKVKISGHLSSRAENAWDDLLSCFIFSAWYKRCCENSSLCSQRLLQHPVCDV